MKNVAQVILEKIDAKSGNEVAYVDTSNRHWTYGEFKIEINQYRHLIQASQLSTEQVICLAPLGFQLIALLIACFAEGKTVIFIDPKLGLKNFFKLITDLKNTSVIYHKQHVFTFVLRMFFRNLEFIKLGHAKKTIEINTNQFKENNPRLMDGFTSGTTGTMKRIQREHAHMIASSALFNKHIVKLNPDRHLVGYTLSVVRNLIDQGTAFEISKKNKYICTYIENYQITRLSGPPILLYKAICSYEKMNMVNTTIKNIVIGGAPAQYWLIQKAKIIFPNAIIQNIYGCTECEPIAISNDQQMLSCTQHGYFVGNLVDGLISELRPLDENLFELFLQGPQVTKSEGHLTGDLVRKSKNDNGLILVGRKSYLLKNDDSKLYGQYEIESFIERNDLAVKKAAVLQNNNRLYIFIEYFVSHEKNNDNLKSEITKNFSFNDIQIKNIQKFPYDSRHQWKVQYQELRKYIK